jgi:hypothetical protein
MSKVLKAEKIVIPDDIINVLGNSVLSDGKTFNEKIVESGNARNRFYYYMAIGMANSFDDILETYRKLKRVKKISSRELFSNVLLGISISYMLGHGSWDRKTFSYNPKLVPSDIFFSSDSIELRNGSIHKPKHLFNNIRELTNVEKSREVFNEVFPKKFLWFRSRKGSKESYITLLSALMSLIDTKIANSNK